jgi:molybdenum cofactor cytidylyltransferase
LKLRGILLCGGEATRFGARKLLHPVPGGPQRTLPMAAAAARPLVQALERVLAVIPPGDRDLREVLEAQRCEVMETDRTARGLGASLAAGIAATADADGWIVALGDMPFIEAKTIAAVAEALRAGAAIAAPWDERRDERGHPVGFGAPLRAELVSLDGDAGARSVVHRHRDALVKVPVHDPGIFADIDTPEDLDRWNRPR